MLLTIKLASYIIQATNRDFTVGIFLGLFDVMSCTNIALPIASVLLIGTNLIHDFTAVTFSVKFREIRDFGTFTFIYEGFQSFIIQQLSCVFCCLLSE